KLHLMSGIFAPKIVKMYQPSLWWVTWRRHEERNYDQITEVLAIRKTASVCP
ncbi:hypothetical protein WMY93_031464, partial [Mugilogobius chulae]